jgi:hypothetical protein
MRAALALVSILALAACNRAGAHGGDGNGDHRVIKQNFPVTAFTGVALEGGQDVIVQVGAQPSVRAEGDAETIGKLDIRVENGQLRIGHKKGNDFHWGWHKDRPRVRIYVTTPSLAAASIGGSGDMQVDRVEGQNFTGSIGGSGDMRIGTMKVGDAKFAVAGSGGIVAAGTANSASLSIAGSGDIDAGALESRTATLSVAGSGDLKVKAMETAQISIVGSGDAVVTGPAKCTISKMGSGSANCGG